MTSWGLSGFLQNVREQVAPDVQEFVGDISPEDQAAIESGLRDVLTLARPLFGPNEVADGFSLFPEPVLNVNDATSESASVLIPDDVYLFSLGLLDIGGRFGPLSELFSQAVNLNFDRDADDDDAEQVLKEFMDGDGGAVLDTERKPGIEGVELISITPDSYTLSFANSDALDVLTLEGPGIEAVINKLDAPADVADSANALSLVDLSEETVEAGSGAANPIAGIADAWIDTEGELARLIKAALDPADERVDFLSIEPDSFAARVDNPATSAFDVLIFEGSPAENAVASAASDVIDPSNGVSEFTIADVTDNDVVAAASSLDLYFGGIGSGSPAVTEDELLGILSTANQRPRVNAIDQGDTVRLEILSENDTRDVIVFATDQPVPGGAFDGDLFA
jgi:hypothetical protein